VTLERDLRALAARFPETPALAPGVLIAVQQASLRRRRRRRVAALALALALLVPATALAVSPGLRERVLETFGLRGVRVVRVSHLPAVGPGAGVLPPVSALRLGRRVSLPQARAALQLQLNPPSALGTPSGIYRQRLAAGVDDVSFLYEPGSVAARVGAKTRVLVSVLRGTLSEPVLRKSIGFDTKVTHLRIEGGQALLLTGAPHRFFFFLRQGQFEQAPMRIAGTVLLWQRGALLVRIEGKLTRSTLLAIARSISTG